MESKKHPADADRPSGRGKRGQAARALGISFGDTSDLAGPFGVDKRNAVEEGPIETPIKPTLLPVERVPVEWEAAAAYADGAMW